MVEGYFDEGVIRLPLAAAGLFCATSTSSGQAGVLRLWRRVGLCGAAGWGVRLGVGAASGQAGARGIQIEKL